MGQRDLNPRPIDYESTALTTELWALNVFLSFNQVFWSHTSPTRAKEHPRCYSAIQYRHQKYEVLPPTDNQLNEHFTMVFFMLNYDKTVTKPEHHPSMKYFVLAWIVLCCSLPYAWSQSLESYRYMTDTTMVSASLGYAKSLDIWVPAAYESAHSPNPLSGDSAIRSTK